MTPSERAAKNRLKNKILIERIEMLMARRGLKSKTLSERVGRGTTLIHDILSGKSGRQRMETIQAIARALGTTAAFLTGEADAPTISDYEIRQLPVVGFAEAGAFRAMTDFHNAEHLNSETIAAMPSSAFPNARHFALKIRGDSMNAARPAALTDGMIGLFVDFADAGLEIESGRIYAIRRTQDGGQTWECTIKRARVFRDRYELSPESTNPSHQSVVLPRGPAPADEEAAVEVIGLLYAVQFSFE